MTRTFADMPPAGQSQRIGTWFDLLGASYLVILADPDGPFDGHATVMVPSMGKTTYTPKRHLTPRYDLPRAWTPSGEHAPGEWEEKVYQDGIGDYVRFTRQRRYVTDWEVPDESR